ncbi:hypothetical protein PTSG_10178 [Salpingoeca rosetta]|uniref:Uncharacterized protein n=1 Tax=Salpingoeca rosetta (strain ATCC 50818 / BSB-021) TaxID=946362 RepID=F2UQI9_SALR5|nr:uncharacterized protein PTSG_10178 [Salpingoeca rosetta]EGD79894.1 hypothetical protein PTSG_10178 [Salpingoeca rosetta]|eukprot:XP_004988515.1 hypothetical protein PTSG_10178 [Salpingoeca rosetta]
MFGQAVKALRPIREFLVGFAVTGYIFLSIDITDEMKENSKYLNPHKHHDEHH